MTPTLNAEQRRLAAADLIAAHVAVGDRSPYEREPIDAYIGRFREVGFFRSVETVGELEGIPAILRTVDFTDTLPREAVVLFRTCDPGLESRLSWTSSLGVAMTYAPGGLHGSHHPNAHLFSVVMPADRVLAIINEEWVVDPRGLTIVDHGRIRYHSPQIIRLAQIPEQPTKAALIAQYGPHFPVRMQPAASVTLATRPR